MQFHLRVEDLVALVLGDDRVSGLVSQIEVDLRDATELDGCQLWSTFERVTVHSTINWLFWRVLSLVEVDFGFGPLAHPFFLGCKVEPFGLDPFRFWG